MKKKYYIIIAIILIVIVGLLIFMNLRNKNEDIENIITNEVENISTLDENEIQNMIEELTADNENMDEIKNMQSQINSTANPNIYYIDEEYDGRKILQIKPEIQYEVDLAGILKKGDVIVLSGELGAGKTKFVEGLLNHFGLQDEISSPTFTIVNEYKNEKISIFHFDLYRLSDIDEFYAIGGEEYLSNGICIFEWGEMLEDVLKKDYTKITFKKSNFEDDYREILVEEF